MAEDRSDFLPVLPRAGSAPPAGRGSYTGEGSARRRLDPPSYVEPAVPGFRSVLFPPGCEAERRERHEQPACFVDLNLDQIVAGISGERDEGGVRALFYATYRNERIIRYRQGIFADLERPDITHAFASFCDAMRTVLANLAYARQISSPCHQQTVHLSAIYTYCAACRALREGLDRSTPCSEGLRALAHYLSAYTSSEPFTELARGARELRDSLAQLSYEMLFRGSKVTVRRHASAPDYAAMLIARFARFREVDREKRLPRRVFDDFSLNHVEERILEFVSRLFPREFQALTEYVTRHSVFIDEVIMALQREIRFFLAFSAFIEPIRKAGLAFCYPEVSATSKELDVSEAFDLALAAKLVRQERPVIGNDFFLHDPERLVVVSGPNQGGKTTFARMFGQVCFLAGLGCPVPGKHARLFLPDRIFTHFEREEDITDLRSKLEEELVRLHRTCQEMTSESVLILNEVFTSTGLEDQIVLSTEILRRILAIDAISLCVTFIDSLSTLSARTVSMVSTLAPGEPARRTFKIVRREADGLAYALSLARKHGVTYELLRRRVRP